MAAQTHSRGFVGNGDDDKEKVPRALWHKGQIEQIIPPQHNAVKSKGDKPWLQSRDHTIEAIEQTDKKTWKESVGYHKRSLSETAMHRYKTIIGGKLQSRTMANQQVEAKISCTILNKLILLDK